MKIRTGMCVVIRIWKVSVIFVVAGYWTVGFAADEKDGKSHGEEPNII